MDRSMVRMARPTKPPRSAAGCAPRTELPRAAISGPLPLRDNVRVKGSAWFLVLLMTTLFAFGAHHFSTGLYIHAKAHFAQYLIEQAWQRTLEGEQHAKPWPWADTWPVARLSVPDLNIDVHVLAGANGRAIAFGPGHVFGTPLPGEIGNSVIGGHRDTHLSFLRNAVPGTHLSVQLADGRWARYRVSETEVVDKSDVWVAENVGPTRLTLITCYPFDALRAGGPERFVVTAMRI